MNKDLINTTLENYAIAYCAKDIDAMMRVFDDSNNISVIGTGENEFCIGRKEVKNLFLNNFKEATANKFKWIQKDFRISNDHAIVSVKLNIYLEYNGEQLVVPLRWTVVQKYNGKRWVWLHRHASTPATNQDVDQAYPKDK